MLAYILAVLVGTGSVGLYAAAFLLPEVHRKHDFIWSGLGLFYALFLWIYAQQVTGGILVGQTTSVALLGWLAWQIFKLRRQVPPVAVQPTVTPSTKPATTKTAAVRPENRTAKTAKPAAPNATTGTTTASPNVGAASPLGNRATAAVKANPTRSNPATPANPSARTASPAAPAITNPERAAATAKPPATANSNPARAASLDGNRAANRPSGERAPASARPAAANPNAPTADPAPQQSGAPAQPPTTVDPLPVTIEVAVEPKRQSPPPQNQNPTPAAKPAQPTANEAWIKLETTKPPATTPLGGAIQPPHPQAQPTKPPIADMPLPQSGDLDALLEEIETTVKQDIDRPQS